MASKKKESSIFPVIGVGIFLFLMFHFNFLGWSGGSSGLGADLHHAPTSLTHNEQLAKRLAAKVYGWNGREWVALYYLWDRESAGTWSPTVTNPKSGAYGIPQALPRTKMASAGSNWQTSAKTQIRWGLSYIKRRYGDPENAWRHELAYNWY